MVDEVVEVRRTEAVRRVVTGHRRRDAPRRLRAHDDGRRRVEAPFDGEEEVRAVEERELSRGPARGDVERLALDAISHVDDACAPRRDPPGVGIEFVPDEEAPVLPGLELAHRARIVGDLV